MSVLQAADGALPDARVILDTLAADFALDVGPARVVRRTLLDTFDHRLCAAGLTLTQHGEPSGEQLVLRRAGRPVTCAAVGGARWPALAAALPSGPLRDAVGAASGIRALMVVGDERRRQRRVDLRDQDAKIVARVDVDVPTAGSGGAVQVRVHALTGYSRQARRVTALVTGLGFRPVTGEQCAPVTRGTSAAEPIGRDAPAVLLLAGVLGGFVTAMRENLPGVLDDVDTEFLHDVRVAVRRTRSTLKLARPALPETMRTRWEPAFKWLGDLTTPVRDLDVYLLDLPTMAQWLVAADAADLTHLDEHLRRSRAVQRRTLVRGLRSARFERLLEQWDQTLAELAQSCAARPTAGELSDASIGRAHRKVVRAGAAITVDSPAQSLHTLRKRCKELRYALEVFAPVTDKPARKAALADLKGLQDVLGRFQDCEVQREALREFAHEMMTDGTPAQAVLAMGELIGHLDTEQQQARERFDGAFAQFTRASSARRLRRLAGAR